MITVSEIRRKSERKYETVLKSVLNNEVCFPLEIRSDKVLSKDFNQMSKEIAEVLSGSKDRRGFGYSVLSETIKTRQHGSQDIPNAIIFETLVDFLKFLYKEKEFRLMVESFSFIKSEIPQLEVWVKKNPKIIINYASAWPSLIKVCQWFLYSFEPQKYYIRELPIPVHTKFIEENKNILRLLLDELQPENTNASESSFEKRFYLKYDEPLIRFRSLDKSCWESNYNDITVPIEQFKSTELNCTRVFIIENKMNFLAFPEVYHSIAIWGKGFAVELLKNIKWFDKKEVYYWSDLDVQGFQMLSQLRSYYPQTKSILMEMGIIKEHIEFIVRGTQTFTETLPNLSELESEVYEFLLKNSYRLEQERIHQNYVVQKVKSIEVG